MGSEKRTNSQKFREISYLIFLFLMFPVFLWSQQDSISYDPYIASLIMQVDDSNIDQHIQNLAHADGHFSRVSYTPGNEWAAHYIKQAFDSLPGLTHVFFDTFFVFNAPPPYDTIPLVNVVAVLEGSQFPSQEYLIGGHFDATANLDPSYNWEIDWPTAIAPGADDNATGVACILEIARILSDSSNGFNNDYTIKFVAFGAEERHPAYNNANHWGSRSYVLEAFSSGDDIKETYILDMIGFNDTGNNYYNIVSDPSSQQLGRRLLQVNQTYQIGLNTNSEPFPEAYYSDHDQFWIYGYEAILAIENAPPWTTNPPWYNANPFYHKQSDTPDKVNIQQVGKIAQSALGVFAHLTGNITSIEEERVFENIPQAFSLRQNYPNPFNPSTTIEFDIFQKGNVTLEIYNFLGEKVVNLINKEMSPGSYRIHYDASDLSSGVYFYTLKAGENKSIKKMTLIK
jgi:hypothetical protein